MNRVISISLLLAAACLFCGCESPAPSISYSYDSAPLRAYRTPPEMSCLPLATPAPSNPLPTTAADQPEGDKPQVPVYRPLPKQSASAPTNDAPIPSPADVIEVARDKATQHPTPEGFINAVQVYQYVPGAVYEIITAPLFATMVRLRPGEELKNLAAGDTSRWIIDVVGAGNADSEEHQLWPQEKQPEPGVVLVLIKPRFPLVKTNLFITTNERTYIIDLKSTEQTYHSAVEWTYPQRKAAHSPATYAPAAASPVRDTSSRNYLYTLKAPPGEPPPWAPTAVYDDGHRVYIEFDHSINDMRRPPFYLLDSDGKAVMSNYRTEGNRYVVNELFDRGALRIGDQRVVIERTLRRPSTSPYVAQATTDKE